MSSAWATMHMGAWFGCVGIKMLHLVLISAHTLICLNRSASAAVRCWRRFRGICTCGCRSWEGHLSFLADLAGLVKETANVTQAVEGEAFEPMNSFILVNDKFIKFNF